MNGRFIWAAAGAVTAGLLATAAGGAQSALAAPRGIVNVPCRTAALTAAIKGASSGETLSLAPLCTYGLTAALPPISEKLTIKGNHATIEGQNAGTPDFAILTVGSFSGSHIGTLAVSDLNISGGAPGIDLLSGAVSVSGGRFSANATAIENISYTTLQVTGATFTDNTGEWGGAISDTDSVSVTNSTFTRNSWPAGRREPPRAMAIRAAAPRWASPRVPAAGTDRPVTAGRAQGPGFPPGNLAPDQARRVLHAAFREQAARVDGRGEGLEVLLVLVGVRRGEVRDRVVEYG
jgi:hypothetical protein